MKKKKISDARLAEMRAEMNESRLRERQLAHGLAYLLMRDGEKTDLRKLFDEWQAMSDHASSATDIFWENYRNDRPLRRRRKQVKRPKERRIAPCISQAAVN